MVGWLVGCQAANLFICPGIYWLLIRNHLGQMYLFFTNKMRNSNWIHTNWNWFESSRNEIEIGEKRNYWGGMEIFFKIFSYPTKIKRKNKGKKILPIFSQIQSKKKLFIFSETFPIGFNNIPDWLLLRFVRFKKFSFVIRKWKKKKLNEKNKRRKWRNLHCDEKKIIKFRI